MESVTMDREQLKELKLTAICGRPYWDRISIALAIRLLDKADPYFDHFSVLNELDYLEGIRSTSNTKPEEQFKNEPLYPLWHKHFFLPKHVARNVAVRWNMQNGGNTDLKAMLSEVSLNYGESPDIWPNRLTQRIVVQGFDERAQRGLTGDWIIYARHAEKNFYLDLAIHEEGHKYRANALLQRIRNGSRAEYPFLYG